MTTKTLATTLMVGSCLLYSLTAQSQITGAPTCSSPASDFDGDGWGWENNASCLVDTADTPTVTTPPGIRRCTSSNSDPDGDGWGWENNASCIVSSTPASNPGTTAPINPPTQNQRPLCLSSASDPDGDGYGWENNQTCLVVLVQTTSDTSPPAAPEAPADPSPAVTQPGTLKIMALGDSITHGVLLDNATSYRETFINLLDANTCDYEMVGSQTGNFGHNTFQSPHEGYNGHTADQILNGFSDIAGNNEGISVTMNRYQPEAVLLHVGTNDIRLNQNIAETIGEIDQIISVILSSPSEPQILIANLVPWYSVERIEQGVQELGTQIEQYVSQLSNPDVTLVDVRTGYRPDMMLSDRAHPNDTGEDHIARAFYQVFEQRNLCR